MKKFIVALLFLGLGIIMVECKKKPLTLAELIQKQGNLDKKTTELFMGFQLGMTMEEFFPFCRKLNAEGKLFDGDGAMVSKMNCNDLSKPAFIYLEPLFTEKVMTGQRLYFYYQNASIFSEDLSDDNLDKDVFQWMVKRYGSDYARVTNGDQQARVWIKDGLKMTMTRELQRIKIHLEAYK